MTWWRCVQLRVGLWQLSGSPPRPSSFAVRWLCAFLAVRGNVRISSLSSGFAIMPRRLPVTIQKKLVTVSIQRNCCRTFFSFPKKENYPRSIALQWSRLLILSAFFGIAALDSERRDILSFRTLVVSIRLSSVSCSSQLYLLCKAFSSYPAEWVLSERNDLHRLHRSYHFFVYSLRLFEYCRLPSFTSSQFQRLLKFLILRWAPFQQFSMYSCFFILTFRLTRKQWRCLLVALLSRLKDSFCLL